MTPDQASATIAELARRAYEELLRRIRAGETPRAAADAALAAFRGPYYQQVADALGVILKASLGPAAIKAWPVGKVTLSQALYAWHRAISAATAATVNAHLQGLHSARDLAKTLYEGYDFKPDTLKVIAKLPKYLRVEFDRALAANLKTPALRAAYLQAIQAAEAGAGQAKLERVLKVAFYERNRYLANRIARTEIARAQNAQIARELLADDHIGFVQLRLSSKHPKPDICDLHATLNAYGLGPGVYPKAEAPLPPFHPHCLPGDALITASGRVTAVSKRWYDGDMVVITTASGQQLAATVNHPVLTRHGWVAISQIQIGDQVFCRIGGQGVGVGNDQHQNMPARIAEIADSFFRSRQVATREVPIAAEDFHGDGMAGQIAVIGADSQLWDRLDAMSAEAIKNNSLMVTHETHALLGNRVFDFGFERFGMAAYRRMSSFRPLLAKFGWRLCILQALGFAIAARLNPMQFQAMVDHASADAHFLSETQNGTAGLVFADQVVGIDVKSWHGDVYNLETEQGHYTSNNIITHNCYCLVRPLLSIPPDQKVKAQPNAARAFLKSLPADEARQVMGGRERLRRVLEDGDSIEAVVNTNVDPLYHARRMGDVLEKAGPGIPIQERARMTETPATVTAFVDNCLNAPRTKQPPLDIESVSLAAARTAAGEGLSIDGKRIALDHDYTRHALLHHGGPNERLRGQEPITNADLALAGALLNQARSIKPGVPPKSKNGCSRLEIVEEMGGYQYTVIYEVRRASIVVYTMFKRPK